VRFWDSSALVPLVIEEPSSRMVERIATEDPEIAAWWATRVECEAAIARRARAFADGARSAEAAGDLAELASRWIEVPPGERLRDLAVRSVRIHDLRAGDALQLAAALVVSEERPATLDLVTLDGRLALAARREGFHVLPA
jgi:uncharacterized protein